MVFLKLAVLIVAISRKFVTMKDKATFHEVPLHQVCSQQVILRGEDIILRII